MIISIFNYWLYQNKGGNVLLVVFMYFLQKKTISIQFLKYTMRTVYPVILSVL